MTPKEILEGLKTLLQSLAWSGGDKIFGANVSIVPSFPMQHLTDMVFPSCYIIEEGQRNHSQHEGIISLAVTLYIILQNVGEHKGEGSIIGGNRIANSSKGAGILDIENILLKELRETTALSTAKIVLEGIQRIKTSPVKNNLPAIIRQIRLSARAFLY
jgi:hypothetical protein